MTVLQSSRFREAFAHFQRLIAANDKGHPFTNFHEGVAATWEDYKPRLRKYALGMLNPGTWTEAQVGSGAILQHTISAIEIQDSRANL
ncbi:hypothetical protein [Dankookia rubra]|uniref:hypothetical protein n=1 Tax=Dankookia rubra TaxID=1442381 RepID=UPI0019D50D61|nr:hypothetical protein [Dankookia rubra]